jgi:serine/threonine protein kinase
VDDSICDQLIKALSYIHDKYSVVLNLKKSNIFIDQSGNIKITDIAIPVLFDYELEDKENDVHLAMYCPPEMENELIRTSYKCDIWNLGILFFEIYKKSHPFDAVSSKEATKLIKKGFKGIELDSRIFDDIIRKCLNSK